MMDSSVYIVKFTVEMVVLVVLGCVFSLLAFHGAAKLKSWLPSKFVGKNLLKQNDAHYNLARK